MSSTDQFRLATLLRLRENVRDKCRLDLAESRRKDEELAGQLDRLDAERQSLDEENRRTAGPGSIDVERLRESMQYASTLRSRRAVLLTQRRSLADEIDRRRHALVEADRGVRVLEKLRERQQQRVRRDEERRQIKQMDEAALLIPT